MQSIRDIRDFDKVSSFQTRLNARTSQNLTNNYISKPKGSNNQKIFNPNISDHKLNTNPKFNFKYVSEQELEAVVKRVRRTNQKKRDEKDWEDFLKRQENKLEDTARYEVCEVCSARETDNFSEQQPESSSGNGQTESSSSRPSSVLAQEEETLKPEESETELKSTSRTRLNSVTTEENITYSYQLGPGVRKRLHDLVIVVGRLSAELRSPAQPQYEDEDVERTIKRSLEFDAMFARNHLYEIQRILKDTKQLRDGKCSAAEMEGKISAALKCITQALQVYVRHVTRGSRVKYQQVVAIFQSISYLLGLLQQLTGQRLFPFRQEIEVSCSYVRQTLLEMSATDTKTISTMSHRPRLKQRQSVDLTMYTRRRKSALHTRSRVPTSRAKKHHTNLPSRSSKRVVSKGSKIAQADCNPERNSVRDNLCDTSVQIKEPPKLKEVPYRKATRAVAEDNVTTMMEMIPQEKSPTRSDGENEGPKTDDPRRRPVSAKSSHDDTRNVLLLCIKEGDHQKGKATSENREETAAAADELLSLVVSDATRADLLQYQRSMAEHHAASPVYRDGKAISILDRVANRILTEMVVDFQQNMESGMDDLIKTLYRLELE